MSCPQNPHFEAEENAVLSSIPGSIFRSYHEISNHCLGPTQAPFLYSLKEIADYLQIHYSIFYAQQGDGG
jgi:hypothetical protein